MTPSQLANLRLHNEFVRQLPAKAFDMNTFADGLSSDKLLDPESMAPQHVPCGAVGCYMGWTRVSLPREYREVLIPSMYDQLARELFGIPSRMALDLFGTQHAYPDAHTNVDLRDIHPRLSLPLICTLPEQVGRYTTPESFCAMMDVFIELVCAGELPGIEMEAADAQ